MSHPIWFAYRSHGFSTHTVSATQPGHPVSVDVVSIDVPRSVREAMPHLAQELADVMQRHLQQNYGATFKAIG